MRGIHPTVAIALLVTLIWTFACPVECSRGIIVHGPNDVKFNVTVRLESSIRDIKSMLVEPLNLRIGQQKLFLNGTELDNNKTVFDYKLWRSPELKLEVDTYGKPIELEVICHGSKLGTVEVGSQITVEKIKSIIFFSLGSYPESLYSQSPNYYSSRELSDNSILDEKISKSGTPTIYCTKKSSNSLLLPIKYVDGKSYPINVGPHDTIASVKLKIEFESGIAAEKQKLLIDGAEEDIKLTNDETLAHYKIWNYAGLKLITKPKIKLSVYCKPSVNITIEVEADEPIENIRSILAKELGIPNEVQGLTSNDRIMQDGSRLSEYHHATGLVLIPGEQSILELTILHGRHKISLRAGYALTIKEVKSKIEANYQIPANRQRLFLNDLELLDGKTLRDYKLYKETSLKLVVADDPSLKIKFRVKNLLGQEVSFDLPVNENIGNLKKLIAESPLKIPTHKQRLFFLGHELADENTLRQCKITKDCLVQVASYGNRDLDTALDEDDDDEDAN